nr:immunoglobulin heavy chain junction region [Mus musculus]
GVVTMLWTTGVK